MTTQPLSAGSQRVHNEIKKTLSENSVVLFMKGTPESPMCGFSAQVVKILREHPVSYHAINILADEALRAELKVYSGWPTFPQLYVRGELIGGCDIVMELERKGELSGALVTE